MLEHPGDVLCNHSNDYFTEFHISPSLTSVLDPLGFQPHPICVRSVTENLTFTCKMYEPSLSKEECDKRVGEVLANLGLEGCKDTKVKFLLV